MAVDHRYIELGLPKGANTYRRQAILDSWYRKELREAASARIEAWQSHLDVEVDRFFIQRMKTKWGGGTPQRQTIGLNLELAKKDIECLDYVILHELAHSGWSMSALPPKRTFVSALSMSALCHQRTSAT